MACCPDGYNRADAPPIGSAANAPVRCMRGDTPETKQLGPAATAAAREVDQDLQTIVDDFFTAYTADGFDAAAEPVAMADAEEGVDGVEAAAVAFADADGHDASLVAAAAAEHLL
eukprot:tig00000459_g1108.t1